MRTPRRCQDSTHAAPPSTRGGRVPYAGADEETAMSRDTLTYHLEEAAPDACVFHLSGMLRGSQASYDFQEAARDRLDEGTKRVVIDLSKVTMLDSTGIGIIATLITAAKEAGGRIGVAGATRRTEQLLQLVHILDFVAYGPDAASVLAKL
jgi:anti-anti-sigma factor